MLRFRWHFQFTRTFETPNRTVDCVETADWRGISTQFSQKTAEYCGIPCDFAETIATLTRNGAAAALRSPRMVVE